MILSLVRRSRFLRALLLTTGVFSFLLWLYIVMRILLNEVDLKSPFIYGVPGPPIWVLGAMAFAVSFLCTLLYLWLWGRFGGTPTSVPGYEERQP